MGSWSFVVGLCGRWGIQRTGPRHHHCPGWNTFDVYIPSRSPPRGGCPRGKTFRAGRWQQTPSERCTFFFAAVTVLNNAVLNVIITMSWIHGGDFWNDGGRWVWWHPSPGRRGVVSQFHQQLLVLYLATQTEERLGSVWHAASCSSGWGAARRRHIGSVRHTAVTRCNDPRGYQRRWSTRT